MLSIIDEVSECGSGVEDGFETFEADVAGGGLSCEVGGGGALEVVAEVELVAVLGLLLYVVEHHAAVEVGGADQLGVEAEELVELVAGGVLEGLVEVAVLDDVVDGGALLALDELAVELVQVADLGGGERAHVGDVHVDALAEGEHLVGLLQVGGRLLLPVLAQLAPEQVLQLLDRVLDGRGLLEVDLQLLEAHDPVAHLGLVLLRRLVGVLVLLVVAAGDVGGGLLALALLGELEHLHVLAALLAALAADQQEELHDEVGLVGLLQALVVEVGLLEVVHHGAGHPQAQVYQRHALVYLRHDVRVGLVVLHQDQLQRLLEVVKRPRLLAALVEQQGHVEVGGAPQLLPQLAALEEAGEGLQALSEEVEVVGGGEVDVGELQGLPPVDVLDVADQDLDDVEGVPQQLVGEVGEARKQVQLARGQGPLPPPLILVLDLVQLRHVLDVARLHQEPVLLPEVVGAQLLGSAELLAADEQADVDEGGCPQLQLQLQVAAGALVEEGGLVSDALLDLCHGGVLFVAGDHVEDGGLAAGDSFAVLLLALGQRAAVDGVLAPVEPLVLGLAVVGVLALTADQLRGGVAVGARAVLLLLHSNPTDNTTPWMQSHMEEYPSSHPPLRKSDLALRDFLLPPEELKPLYHDASPLPVFFRDHLLTPHRVVKHFSGPYAAVEAFYYQLMKLALEVEVEGRDYLGVIRNCLVGRELFEEGELGDELLTDQQYRSFMGDFIDRVEGQEVPHFDGAVMECPIIDQILKRMFRLVVPYPMVAEPCSDQQQARQSVRAVLERLSGMFGVRVSELEGCLKFEEADMFVHVESKEEVYLAFVDEIHSSGEDGAEEVEDLDCINWRGDVPEKEKEQVKVQQTATAPTADRQSAVKAKDFKKSKFSAHFKPLSPTQTPPSSVRFPLSSRSPNSKPAPKSKKTLGGLKRMSSLLWKADTCTSFYMTEGRIDSTTEQLYKEFTDSRVLEQMGRAFTDNIRGIKGKYRERRGVGPLGSIANC